MQSRRLAVPTGPDGTAVTAVKEPHLPEYTWVTAETCAPPQRLIITSRPADNANTDPESPSPDTLTGGQPTNQLRR
ncbi:hypothetical protein KUCAC02_004959 [Chaenocephalus aceratus]|uniref:Uncharacterized protein n=1 Tax=Chaenocephalus aceratus TaxID=36190 RepID=A0ACB9X057_CHAAC|nr:hypothetical protein KUCAC02_004959 [Chaenocephalus aceratus]